MLELTVFFFAAVMLYAAYSDLRAYTLPNSISVILVAGFICVALYIQPSIYALLLHVAVMGVVFAVGFALFASNMFGGGDVKVLTALALWFGPNNAFSFFILMAIFGGVVALLILIYRRFDLPESWQKNRSLAGLHDAENGVPYGVAIAAAALIEFPNSAIYSALA